MYLSTTFLCTWVHGVILSWINYSILLRRESKFLNSLTCGSEAKLKWKISGVTGQPSLSGSHGSDLAKCSIEFLIHEVTSQRVGGHKGQLSIQKNLSLRQYSPLNSQSFLRQSAHWDPVHFGIVWPRSRILSCASVSVPVRYLVVIILPSWWELCLQIRIISLIMVNEDGMAVERTQNGHTHNVSWHEGTVALANR